MAFKKEQFSKLFSKYSILLGRFKNRKTLIAISVLILIGILYTWNYREYPGYNLFGKWRQETEVAKQDGKIKITANTDIIKKTRYLRCRDEEIFTAKASDNLIGLNYNELQKNYPGWVIEKFDAKEVELVLGINSMCREHANNTFIGIKDGRVAVFYGVPGPKALLKELTDIPAKSLLPEDLQDLQRGLVVGSKEELLKTLEGMHGK